MFDEVLIAGDRLTQSKRAVGDTLAFKVRLPWYRSIYLSCLDGIELSLDGRPQAVHDIYFSLYGTTYPFAELVKHHSVLWFVLDQAEILVKTPSGLDADTVEVDLNLFFRVPYHRRMNFQQVSTCSRPLRIEERISL